MKSAICARGVLHIRAVRSVRRVPFPWSTENPILIRKNASNAENVRQSVRMMRSRKKSSPCKNACGVGAIVSDKYGRAYIDTEKCVPAECVW